MTEKKLEKTYRDMLNEDKEEVKLDEAKAVKEEGGLNKPEDEDKEDEKDMKEAKAVKEADDEDMDDEDELEEGNEAELNKKLKAGQNKLAGSTTKKMGKQKQENKDPESITMKESEEKSVEDALQEQAKEANAEMSSLLEGQEELDESHKEQVKTLFEAALTDRTRIIKESLEAKFEKDLQEAVEEAETSLVESLDKYLDKVVNEWLEENRLAVEGGIKSEITESFLTGLKTLMDDHYVDVPEEKMDIVENVINENEDLETKLNESLQTNLDLEKELDSFRKREVVDQLSEGLALTEKERLNELSEDIDYGDKESFSKKVKTIKENFIKNAPSDEGQEILNEGAGEEAEDQKNDPVAQRYLNTMNRMSVDKFDVTTSS